MKYKFFTFVLLTILSAQTAMGATINLQYWNKETNTKTAGQCTVGNTIILPTPPTRTGYTFNGWKVQKYDTCNLCTIDNSKNGTSYTFYEISGSSGMGASIDALSPGEFVVYFQDGKIRGKALCSSTSYGTYSAGIIPDETSSGDECWCQATQYVSNGTPCNTIYSPWVHYTNRSGCATECSYDCARAIKDTQYFRGQMTNYIRLRNPGHATSTSGASGSGEFSLVFNHGTITGKALCSSTVGTRGQVGTPSETSSGQYCWCKLTSYKPTVCTSTQTIVGSAWVAYGNAGSAGSCTGACGTYCRGTSATDDAFQNALLGN